MLHLNRVRMTFLSVWSDSEFLNTFQPTELVADDKISKVGPEYTHSVQLEDNSKFWSIFIPLFGP